MNDFNHALTMHQNGQLAEARHYYLRVLEHDPSHPDALHLLGLIEFQERNHAEAERLIRAAIGIRGDIPDYHFNYGLLLSDQGRFSEAEFALRKSLLLRPADAGVLFALNNVLYALGRYVEAEESCRRAQSLAPRDSQICLGLANDLIAQNRLDDAREVLEEALKLRPDFAEAYGNMGAVFRRKGMLEEAENYLGKALQINPLYAEALSNMGAVLLDKGRLEEAEAALRAALEVRPAYASALSNLGNVLMIRRRVAEAGEAYARAIEIAPEFADAHWNLSLLYLLRGDFHNGWREYEWRLKRPDTRGLYPSFTQPEWDGAALNGRAILLYAEQGLGDTLQFIRFAPMAAAHGGRVIVHCQPPLRGLLRTMPGVESVVVDGDPLPPFDVQCSLLSLPGKLGVDAPAKIPADIPYLVPDAALVKKWEGRLAVGHRPRIGLVWAGAPRKDDLDAHLIDRRRSIPLAAFEPLLQLTDIDFYSLQKGEAGQEAAIFKEQLIDLMDEVHDFADTAALIAHLDIVISVDTAVVHLAGALGKPVWLLSRFDGCWRWLLERDDSPWYPTVRVFRQQQAGEWGAVIKQVSAALPVFVAEVAKRSPSATNDADDQAGILEQVTAGMSRLQQGHVDEADAILQRVLVQAPGHALVLHALGLAALKGGNLQIAEERLEQALASEPGSAEILTALGDVYRQTGRPDAAIDSLREAVRIAPAHAEAYNNLGAVYLARKQLEQAIIAFSMAIHFKPEMVMAHFNLGVAYRELNHVEEAVAAFRRAIELKPDFIEAHVSLGMMWLLMGRLREGFTEYEWRLKLRRPSPDGLPWDGVIAPDMRLLVRFEQGYGDAIQFMRYLPFIARHGARLLVQCHHALHPLVSSIAGVSAVYGIDDALPEYDAHCALLSLPHLFQTTLETIPVNVPYLAAVPEKIDVWQHRLAGFGNTIKVGLCWQGNARHGADSDRSADPTLFGKLADIPGITWISLQNRPPHEDETQAAECLGLHDVSAHLRDFSDTAALVAQLDLVISVDTVVAHLAGALNRPVWNLLRYAPDWRWMLERTDSPWYPAMRLFRQRAPGDWNSVAAELEAFLRPAIMSALDRVNE